MGGLNNDLNWPIVVVILGICALAGWLFYVLVALER